MRIRTLALAGAAIAAVAYLFDPVRGHDRRRRLEHTLRSFLDRSTTRPEPPAPLPEDLAPRPMVERTLPPRAAPPVRTEPTEPTGRPIHEPIPMGAGSSSRRPGRSAEDAEVAHRIQETLRARHDLRPDDLIVDVVNGVAYLSGDLHDSHTFGEVVDLTGRVPGVRRVQSLLHLPDSDTVSRGISSRRVGDEDAP